MSTDGWIKYFSDGEHLVGLDSGISTGKTSWSRSRLDGMNRCILRYKDKILEIRGEGDYHQSDDFEVGMLGSKPIPEMTRRRLQKTLEEDDNVVLICRSRDNNHFLAIISNSLILSPPANYTPANYTIVLYTVLDDNMKGKELVLTYSTRSGNFEYEIGV